MEIWKTDLKDKKTFTRIGYEYTQVYFDEERHIGVWKMEKPGVVSAQYEVVKGKKGKNPDGTDVWAYPGDEDFGTLGYYVCGTPGHCRERIQQLLNNWSNEENN